MSIPTGAIEEFDFLDASRNELRRRHRGKYVVIQGRTLLGAFASEEEAYQEGVRHCGTSPFLIAYLADGGERAWVPVLVEVAARDADLEDFVPHDSWRRGEFLDDPIVETATPLPPGEGRHRRMPDID